MRLDGCLRAHGVLRVERPPLLWEADTDAAAFRRLLGELLAHSEGPAGLTLNVSNVTVGVEASGPRLPAGDYVALTVRGRWGPEAVWWPGALPADDPRAGLAALFRAARVRFAYTRDLGPEGSVTVYLGRAG